ncbi:MAG TPA: hypothetical protein VK841_09800 [Polyangiaceae bacterium]|nr:hypothetical protein [Polyangiaceae bacterium]
MKLGPSIASATFVFAFCQCGPLVNDPPLDGGSGTTSGNSGAGTNTGSTSGSVAGASMSGSTTGTTSGTTGSATGASGASSGATAGADTDSATTDTDSGSSGSSAGSSGTSGGGPDATMQGDNLVLNGDFSQGGMYWGISSGTGAIDAGTSQLCVTVGMGSGTVYLGWPQPSTMAGMSLASGTMYTFSYKAQTAQGNVTIEAKVANSMGSSNYMPVDSDSTMDMVTGSLQTFTHTFTPTSNDASAGVVFIFSSQSADTVCFESVSVVAQ